MTAPRVTIIGAGLCGLTLGRALSRRGVTVVLLDRDPAPTIKPRHNYGITVQTSTWDTLRALLNEDGVPHAPQLEHFAVDRRKGRVRVSSNDSASKSDAIRLHRGRLEAALSSKLNIRWSSAFEKVTSQSAGPITVRLGDGSDCQTDILVAADGVHSSLRSQLCSGTSNLTVHEFVVFRGVRQVLRQDFEQKYRSLLDDENEVTCVISSGTRLSVLVDDINDDNVCLSYTYSRPKMQGIDVLHNPNRELAGAGHIPNELFTEIDELDLSSSNQMFKDVFDVKAMTNDRLLHWLMRSVDVEAEALSKLAHARIFLAGDAVHAVPILGGGGADTAVKDAVRLADLILAEIGADMQHSKVLETRRFLHTSQADFGVQELEALHHQA